MISIVTTFVTRRRAILTGIAGLAAASVLRAKSHIARAHVSAITDEIGKTQSDAIAAAIKYKVPAIELRRVPGTDREIAALSVPELKQMGTELTLAKVKTAMLHAQTLRPGVIAAAAIVNAQRIRVAKPDEESLVASLPAIEQAKIQLVLPLSPENSALVEKHASHALGLEWDPIADSEGYANAPKGRILNIRVRILEGTNWRRKFEALDRDRYEGGISLETTLEQLDDAMHDLMRIVDDF
jgi:hypothetical protein